MPVRMLRDERIAINGLDVRWYRMGDIIHVSPPLAEALIRDNIATASLVPEEAPHVSADHQPKNEMPAPKALGRGIKPRR